MIFLQSNIQYEREKIYIPPPMPREGLEEKNRFQNAPCDLVKPQQRRGPHYHIKAEPYSGLEIRNTDRESHTGMSSAGID